jgi:hypothetical protein
LRRGSDATDKNRATLAEFVSMKHCQKCLHANEDNATFCVICNEPLVDTVATLRYDPKNDADEWAEVHARRGRILRRDVVIASMLYALAICVTALVPGLIFDRTLLLYYFLSALAVAFLISKRRAGHFTASFLQGGFSVAMLLAFGPMQPFVFFMLLAHVVFAMLLSHWVEGMRDIYR